MSSSNDSSDASFLSIVILHNPNILMEQLEIIKKAHSKAELRKFSYDLITKTYNGKPFLCYAAEVIPLALSELIKILKLPFFSLQLGLMLEENVAGVLNTDFIIRKIQEVEEAKNIEEIKTNLSQIRRNLKECIEKAANVFITSEIDDSETGVSILRLPKMVLYKCFEVAKQKESGAAGIINALEFKTSRERLGLHAIADKFPDLLLPLYELIESKEDGPLRFFAALTYAFEDGFQPALHAVAKSPAAPEIILKLDNQLSEKKLDLVSKLSESPSVLSLIASHHSSLFIKLFENAKRKTKIAGKPNMGLFFQALPHCELVSEDCSLIQAETSASFSSLAG